MMPRSSSILPTILRRSDFFKPSFRDTVFEMLLTAYPRPVATTIWASSFSGAMSTFMVLLLRTKCLFKSWYQVPCLMSLYNSLYGRNPLSPFLKAMLKLDTDWPTGRFRDIWLGEGGGTMIGVGRATEKLDGTNVRVTVKDSKIVRVEKRRNPTREQKALGPEPGYVDTRRDDPSDKHILAAADNTSIVSHESGDYRGLSLTMIERTSLVEGRIFLPDGEWPCEAIGPKIQGNRYRLAKAVLYPFSFMPIELGEVPRTFEGLRTYFPRHSRLSEVPMEGIVFHHGDGRMAKIKASDFA